MHDRCINSFIEKMAARLSNSLADTENEEDGEQRRETRRKYRELIQNLQGLVFRRQLVLFDYVLNIYLFLSRIFASLLMKSYLFKISGVALLLPCTSLLQHSEDYARVRR